LSRRCLALFDIRFHCCTQVHRFSGRSEICQRSVRGCKDFGIAASGANAQAAPGGPHCSRQAANGPHTLLTWAPGLMKPGDARPFHLEGEHGRLRRLIRVHRRRIHETVVPILSSSSGTTQDFLSDHIRGRCVGVWQVSDIGVGHAQKCV
jgi:hypothetical protein